MSAEDWSEMFHLTNEGKALIHELDHEEFPHPNAARCLTQPARDNLIKAIRFRDLHTNRWRKGTLLAIGVGRNPSWGADDVQGVYVKADAGDCQWVAWARFEFT